jgi:hypothetical protein
MAALEWSRSEGSDPRADLHRLVTTPPGHPIPMGHGLDDQARSPWPARSARLATGGRGARAARRWRPSWSTGAASRDRATGSGTLSAMVTVHVGSEGVRGGCRKGGDGDSEDKAAFGSAANLADKRTVPLLLALGGTIRARAQLPPGVTLAAGLRYPSPSAAHQSAPAMRLGAVYILRRFWLTTLANEAHKYPGPKQWAGPKATPGRSRNTGDTATVTGAKS